MTGRPRRAPSPRRPRLSRIHLSGTAPDTTPLFAALKTFARLHRVPVGIWRAMHVGLDEIVTNVLSHAGTRRRPVEVTVEFARRAHALEAAVIDSGRPFNPLAAPDPDVEQPLLERPIGGLGILLVKKTMDSVTYTREDRRNRLVLRKVIPGAAARPARGRSTGR
jgi:anti-sigma regulatory factor (Ser/Thr protein kinase)